MQFDKQMSNTSPESQALPVGTGEGSSFLSGWGQMKAHVKQWLLRLMFEEERQTRPIGISSFSRDAYQSVEPEKAGVFFRHSNRTLQDYRFVKLIDSHRE
jgi:hypothetical protein